MTTGDRAPCANDSLILAAALIVQPVHVVHDDAAIAGGIASQSLWRSVRSVSR